MRGVVNPVTSMVGELGDLGWPLEKVRVGLMRKRGGMREHKVSEQMRTYERTTVLRRRHAKKRATVRGRASSTSLAKADATVSQIPRGSRHVPIHRVVLEQEPFTRQEIRSG